MRLINKFLVAAVITVSASVSFARVELSAFTCRQVETLLSEGDVIFAESSISLLQKIAQATNSWTSHLGVAMKEADGSWKVYEAKVPFSTKTPLCKFLNRSGTSHYEIKRLNQPLDQDSIRQLYRALNERIGRIYSLSFNYDKSMKDFCSKFVYDIFMDNFGIEIGEIETLQQLFDANPNFDTTLFNIWFLGNIPWQERTITPASQLADSDLYSVFRSF